MEVDLSFAGGVEVAFEHAVMVGRREFIAGKAENQWVCEVNSGRVVIRDEISTLRPGLMKVHRGWHYNGPAIEGVRFLNRFSTSYFYPKPDYYLYAGIDWNGNRFGVIENCLGEHKREERFCVPSCITMEARNNVLGVWTAPQQNLDDIISSGNDSSLVRHVLGMVGRAEYKRRQAPPVLKVSPRAFGTGRRMPIARAVFEGLHPHEED